MRASIASTCVNALHHFTDRAAFFAEAAPRLKPGGGPADHRQGSAYRERRLVGLHPISSRRARSTRPLCAECARCAARWRWPASTGPSRWRPIASRSSVRASEAIAAGVVDPSIYVSSDGVVGRGIRGGSKKLRQANEAAGGELQLVADFRLYATMGWSPERATQRSTAARQRRVGDAGSWLGR